MTIAEVLLYCAFQKIALRGHREGEGSRNRGNVLELLQLISIHDSVVMSKICDGQRNALYTSHGIQDELLVLMAEKVVQKSAKV